MHLPKIPSSGLSCRKMHPDVSSSLRYQGYRGTADGSIFVASWHYCRRRKKIGLKPDTEYIKKVLSFNLDYKVTIVDCHDFFPNLLRVKDLSYVEFFPCSHQKPSSFYRDFSLLSFLVSWLQLLLCCFPSESKMICSPTSWIYSFVFTAPIHTILYIFVQVSEFIYSSQEQCCQFSNWMNWLLA